jgi:7-cyano-7-deazaguanine synthase
MVLMSGGVDSYACAHFMLTQNMTATGLHVDYGQLARECEKASARQICDTLGISLRFVQVRSDTSFGAGEILGRNLFLIATALLNSKELPTAIAIGLHSGSPYYDCSETFLNRVDALLNEHTGGKTSLFAPFRSWTKKQVYEYAQSEGLSLAISYSCEGRGPDPCGECLSCLDRKHLLDR